MNRYNRSLLIGMLLGDGCIKLKRHIQKDGTKSVYAEFCISHSGKQIEYLEHKKKLFNSIIGGKPLKISKGSHTLKNGKAYTSYRFSRCNKYFNLLHKWAYSNKGKKYYTRELLDKLSPQGIALWFQDDGGCSRTVFEYYITSVECRLYTYCSEKEVETILQYFEEVYDLKGKKRFYKTNGSWFIAFNTKESKKLESLIGEFIIPSMKYKLPSFYHPKSAGHLNGEDIVRSV